MMASIWIGNVMLLVINLPPVGIWGSLLRPVLFASAWAVRTPRNEWAV